MSEISMIHLQVAEKILWCIVSFSSARAAFSSNSIASAVFDFFLFWKTLSVPILSNKELCLPK